MLRAGVTRVGEELAALLPGARITDVDTETGTVPPADIVVGTTQLTDIGDSSASVAPIDAADVAPW